MSLRRLVALAVALAASLPVLAAGRAACCASPIAAPKPFCCAANIATSAAPRGCCKAPETPRAEVRASVTTAVAFAPVASAWTSGTVTISDRPVSAEIRLARREHRACSPDDTPPDRLLLNRALLI